jgi:23S rRNA pseudouridine2605 synthase
MRKVGLARALSKLGYCSRSQAADLIRTGCVLLNGRIRRDPETPVDLKRDWVVVNGNAVQAQEKIYLIMNKPRGLVTTTSDERGRETVYDLLRKNRESLLWVAPVGRLDKASEGLLLLTNDSEWGAKIAAPETHLERTYHVQVGSTGGDELAQEMMKGVRTDSAGLLHVRRASLLRSGEKNCWLEIVLDEGKNRQIRRMLAGLDIDVLRLVRVAIGPLILGDLAKGSFRSLTAHEKQALDRAMDSRQRDGVQVAGQRRPIRRFND